MESEPKVRKRTASKTNFIKTPKGTKIIRLPISEIAYGQIIKEPKDFRDFIDTLDDKYKNLFEEDFSLGYSLHDIRYSKKMALKYRRIGFGSNIYTIHPSFVLPYWSGKTANCKNGIKLFLQGVSLDKVVNCYGENQQKWLNRVHHLGHFSIVGTSIRSIDKLPKDLTSDEKITFLNGQEVYACITTGNNCILGADISLREDERGLQNSYGVFKEEILNVSEIYQPNSVNTDGWPATRKAWKSLFESITLILCFLHTYIKIRNIAQAEAHKNLLFQQVWGAFKAETKELFIEKITELEQWAAQNINSLTVLKQIENMKNRAELYATSYDCKGNRTSNMVDRAIRPMEKFLTNSQYFHGNLQSAQLTIRALAIGYNFLPFCQRTLNDKKKTFTL